MRAGLLVRLMVARFVVLAALIVVVEIGPAAAQQFMMGQGTSSCGSWTEARRTKALHQHTHQQWVFGFLSGANLGLVDPANKTITPYAPDFIKGGDFDSVVAWIDNYCSAHPLDSIGTAALALVFELRSRAK
jgi:hypothetical protein